MHSEGLEIQLVKCYWKGEEAVIHTLSITVGKIRGITLHPHPTANHLRIGRNGASRKTTIAERGCRRAGSACVEIRVKIGRPAMLRGGLERRIEDTPADWR